MRAPERPNPSPLSSATVAIGAARYLLRRYRIGPALVILAARTPEGWRTISIGRRDDLFTVGDLVDLHHAVDGRRITADALVVMASDADLGVAVPADVVGDVVRASGQAGVVPVLSG